MWEHCLLLWKVLKGTLVHWFPFGTLKLSLLGCRHSLVDSSAHSIMQPWVRVPSTPSTIYQFILICAIRKDENKRKEAGIGSFLNCPRHQKSLDTDNKIFPALYRVTSVTRLGDLLPFGQLFKARDNNSFTQTAYIFRQFFKVVEIFHFSSSNHFWSNFYGHLATFYWSHWSSQNAEFARLEFSDTTNPLFAQRMQTGRPGEKNCRKHHLMH